MGEEKKIDKLVLAGVALASIGLTLGAYVAFAVAPDVAYLEALETQSDMQRMRMYELLDMQINLGTAGMGLGGLGFLLAIKPAIKTKHPVAFVAVVDGLIAFFLGAAYGTHMFS